MGGSAAETIRQPRDRLKGQPQERSLIAGIGSTLFWLSNAFELTVKHRAGTAPSRTTPTIWLSTAPTATLFN
jgi:hypothetical protein